MTVYTVFAFDLKSASSVCYIKCELKYLNEVLELGQSYQTDNISLVIISNLSY